VSVECDLSCGISCFANRYSDHILRTCRSARVIAAFGGGSSAAALASAAAAAFFDAFLLPNTGVSEGVEGFKLKTLDNCRQFSQRIYPLDDGCLRLLLEEQLQHISTIEWLLQHQQQHLQQQQFIGIKLVVIAAPDAYAAAGRTLAGLFALPLGVHVVPADAFQPGHLQLGLCIVQGTEAECAEIVEFVTVEQELLPQQLISVWICPSPLGSHQCQMHCGDGSHCLIFHSNSSLPVLADPSSFAIAEVPLSSSSWLTSLAAPDAPWKHVIGQWLLALAPTLHLFVPLLPLPYDFTILADFFMSHPNIESVIGIEAQRIAIVDLPFTHPDFPALFETCCRESHTRVVLCTQVVGVIQAQSFRDEVMRVGSLAGRDMLLHGLVPASTGDSDNALAPGELVAQMLFALEESQGGGAEVVQRALKSAAQFAREAAVEPPHGCTARSLLLAGLADGFAGHLTALPVMCPDAPLQWSVMPQQLHPLLHAVHDKSCRQDAMLEQEGYASLLPLSSVIHTWLNPVECVAAALAHAIKRALCVAGAWARDPLMHCYASKNLRGCFANMLVVKVLAQDAAAAAAAADAAASANVSGPAFVVRGADRAPLNQGGYHTGLLHTNASRCQTCFIHHLPCLKYVTCILQRFTFHPGSCCRTDHR
jgi:hypothetical protein